jgi:transposase
LTDSEVYIGLPDFKITEARREAAGVTVFARYTGQILCPHCGSAELRLKDTYQRRVRHEGFGSRHCMLVIEAHKWLCRGCGKYFRQQFPGVLRHQRASEPFRRYIFQQHWDGINRSRLGERESIGHATVERYFQYFLGRKAAELEGATCPRVLGIDEHFFSRKHGFATTFCDLAKHKVYDVVLGRSEAALEAYLSKLKGKEQVRIVCMDLSSSYRALARKHFPNAVIVADRFHVIRLIHQQFFAVWRTLDPNGSHNRGLISLLRRRAKNLSLEQSQKLARYFEQNEAVAILYEFREQLCGLLSIKHRTAKACRPLAAHFLHRIRALRSSPFAPLASLGDTLNSWKDEIGRMWRFTRSNGITEGFHTKMEVLQRQAYGFRNFRNYQLRVVVMCS